MNNHELSEQHNAAAQAHENAAREHRTAAQLLDKGDTNGAMEHSGRADSLSRKALETSNNVNRQSQRSNDRLT